jgi:glycosyltransferase involved in cell wall biosynthesis
MSAPRFSIISCFYNSVHRLEAYFAALERLQFDPGTVEFLFVDNASRDDTGGQLRSRSTRLNAPVQLLHEAIPGLMHARCTGVAQARGDRIVFLDDDNEPAPDYIRELVRLEGTFPEAVLLTGNCRLPQEYHVPPSLEGALPLIIIRDLPGEFSYRLTTYTHSHMPWGAGFTAPRAALIEACSVWLKTDKKVVGRTGTKLSGGEDYWLAHFLTRKSNQVVFSDRLKMIHRVDPGRLEAAYLGRLAFENGTEFLTHLAAILEIKPQLELQMPSNFRLWLQASVGLPLKLLRFMVKADGTTFLHAASSLGLTFSLLLRHFPGRK